MADFAAVLKKTIETQANPTPELRQRVYEKARATIEQKLAAANAPAAVASRQRKALEDSIAEVEAQYAAPVARTSAAGKIPSAATASAPRPMSRPIPPAPAVPKPAPARPRAEQSAPLRAPAPARVAAPVPPPPAPRRAAARAPEPAVDPLDDFLKGTQPAPRRAAAAHPAPDFTKTRSAKPRRRSSHEDDAMLSSNRGERNDWGRDQEEEDAFADDSYSEARERRRSAGKGLVFGLLSLLVLCGAGYAAWTNKDRLEPYLASVMDQFNGTNEAAVQPVPTKTSASGKPTSVASGAGAASGAGQLPQTQKLTQRLLPDGSEADPGPAGDTPGVGEGTSVSASTDQPGLRPQAGGASTQAPQAAVPVGQQAFFYEEKSGQEAGSAKKGTVVWSEVQDSPGEGEPAEPAIRADVTIPESNLKLRMTIRRNTDKSLPASHLIEMIFSVPENFSGGAIENVQRVTFKDTEQSAGSPLIAIPAKIADNFFIVALNDARTAIDTNMTLMRRQQWIDIPITYRNGRRALITVEKGVPGEQVFDKVLKAWGVVG
ncbi:transcriptional regulator [Phyllobacterium leguminum]|uniref:Uncharacterized protein n=1 Tax=Phyllobacterium leguminum TaxID=314237 RepID=A0A318TI82_9HYPH|nr:hypothetical protein C7477_10687 [Phyllobacterium leguminum]